MKLVIHRLAAATATLCIITFFITTLWVELFGTLDMIAQVKSFIVFPGLFILIPAMAITGGTGFALGKERKGRIVQRKKKRMPIVALNGLLVLMPAAILLDQWASVGHFDRQFYALQLLELAAGATNAILMMLSIRDGRQLTRK